MRLKVTILAALALCCSAIYVHPRAASAATATDQFSASGAIPGWGRVSRTIASGAPPNVGSLAQTKDGFLWLGTYAGVYRFDGVAYQRLPPPTGRLEQSEQITALLAARSGDLWVAHSAGGLSVVHHGSHTTFEDPRIGNNQLALMEGPDGTIWDIFVTHPSLWAARISNGKASLIRLGESSLGSLWRSAIIDRSGVLWVAVSGQLHYLRPGANKLSGAPTPIEASASLATLPSGQPALLDSKGLHDIILKDSGVPLLSAKENLVGADTGDRQVLLDAKDGYWSISRDTGVTRYEVTRNADTPFHPVRVGNVKPDLDNPVIPKASLVDREGSLWIGTTLGIDQYKRVAFTPIPRQTGEVASEWAGSTVFRDGNGDVYFQRGGAIYLVGPHGSFTRLPWKGNPEDIPCASPRGGLWISPKAGILERVNVTKLEVRRAKVGAPSPTLFLGCAEDKNARLWINFTPKGSGFVGPNSAKIVSLIAERPAPLTAFAESSFGTVFAYMGRGSLYRSDNDQMHPILRSRDIHLGYIPFAYRQGAATLFGGATGIARLEGTKFRTITSRQYPAFNFISGLVNTSKGQTWIVNSSGVGLLSTNQLNAAFSGQHPAIKIREFDADDGLPGLGLFSLFDANAAVEDKWGNIWVATNNGVAWTNPSALPKNEAVPSVIVETINSGQNVWRSGSDIRLPRGTTGLTIHYTATSLLSPRHVNFRYKLEGIDKTWVDASSRREAIYTNMGPGTYTFRVIAENGDGLWNIDGDSLSFSISPAFYQTKSFLLFCIAVFTLVLWTIYMLRVRSLAQRSHQAFEQRLIERERIARELHDTFLQALQGLVLRFHAAADHLPSTEPARAMLSSTLDLAEDVIVEGRNRVLDLRSSWIASSLREELHDLADRILNGTSTKLSVTTEGRERHIMSGTADEIVNIVRESIFNVVKHADARSLCISILFESGGLQIRIEDDGVGLPASESGDSGMGARRHFGIIGMKERTRSIGGEFDIGRRMEGGTVVRIFVPARRAFSGWRRLWSGPRWVAGTEA